MHICHSLSLATPTYPKPGHPPNAKPDHHYHPSLPNLNLADHFFLNLAASPYKSHDADSAADGNRNPLTPHGVLRFPGPGLPLCTRRHASVHGGGPSIPDDGNLQM